MQIGFIGLGNIGSVMAGHLVSAGYTLAVNDMREESGKTLLARGASWLDTPQAVSESSDIVITSLPGPPQVREVMEGDNGVLSAITSGATWIDMSTTDSDEMKRLAALAEARGVSVLEAPVTGGLALARAGGMTILVGGEKPVFESHREVLQAMGGKICYMGPLGSASIVKVISNLLALGHLILAGEAFVLGKMAGISLEPMLEGIKASSGNSYTIEQEIPLIYDGSYDVGFSLALACKDLGITMDLARQLGVPMEIGGLVEQIFVRAKTQYGEDKNSTQAVKLLEDALNLYLRLPED